jgi:hypothetical protein
MNGKVIGDWVLHRDEEDDGIIKSPAPRVRHKEGTGLGSSRGGLPIGNTGIIGDVEFVQSSTISLDIIRVGRATERGSIEIVFHAGIIRHINENVTVTRQWGSHCRADTDH